MAETLEACGCLVEVPGCYLEVDMTGAWQADDTFFDLIRDRAVTNALLAEIAGKAVADGNLSEKTKLQKQMIRDCLASTNGRAKIETWLPRWLSFPPQSYMERRVSSPRGMNRVAQLLA